MKRCGKCRETKPTASFHRNRSKHDGYHDWCKPCAKERLRQYKQTEKGQAAVARYETSIKGRKTKRRYSQSGPAIEAIRKYQQSARGKAACARSDRRKRLRHPEARNAQDAVYRAVKRGDLPKPATCDDCGSRAIMRDGRSGIQAHHNDYSNPLEVSWLCCQCHADVHRKVIA